ncbi:MAG: tRNA lysidine(34) synthetase TilS [Thermodesulfovibrionales bacterium]
MQSLTARFISTIDKHSLLFSGDAVLVGLSGGPDSVCLLHLLHGVKERFNLKLHAVYVNHNLRPGEVPQEIAFCRELCERLGVTFEVKSIDVAGHQRATGGNRQQAARELRYHAFDEAAFGFQASKICLAHNADDQAETVFMHLVRGSGPQGLSGIPVRRGRIIRPLLEIERSAIEQYLAVSGIGHMVDSSNLKTDYLRNRIRLLLIPELRKLNPNLTDTVTTTTTILQEEERYFDVLVTKTLMKLISRKTGVRVELFLSPLEMMEKVLLRRVLRRVIQETRGIREIGFRHIEGIISLLRDGTAGDRLYLPQGVRVIKGYALLVLTAEKPHILAEYELNPGEEVPLAGAGLVLQARFEQQPDDPGDGKTSVLLDADKLSFPLRVRPRRPGDFFYPSGFGRRKKLQDYFVDEKVPRDERDSVPLLLSEDAIVFVGGLRADERFRPGPDTKNFLRLVIVKGKF